MSAKFRATGDRIDYTPAAAATAGTVVVQGSLVGVVSEPIEANRIGSLAIEGIFDVSKEEVAFTVGQDVYFDDDSDLATVEEGVFMGKCVKAAAVTDSTVRVKLVIVDAAASNTVTGTGTGVA